MKTHNNLYENIITFENLLLAAQKAQKSKRFEPSVLAFNHNLESNIFKLQDELKNCSYQPGPYHGFYIHEPKKRLISAAPYRDRVVHHALCNIIEPVFEKAFIYDTYACRKEKGTHKAVLRFNEYCRQNKYVLKCDIKKYFPSIDHQILKSLIRRKIACKQTLWLIDKTIDNSNPQEEVIVDFPGDDPSAGVTVSQPNCSGQVLFAPGERRKGIPIGNLTSQFFANIYLNGLDHFAKENLRCPHYIRYCDDFVLFGNDKAVLHRWRQEIIGHLDGLRLKLHENKSQVQTVAAGTTFLGFRIFPGYRRLVRDNLILMRRRLKRLKDGLASGETSLDDCRNSIMAWFGHAQWADTFGIRQKIADEFGIA